MKKKEYARKMAESRARATKAKPGAIITVLLGRRTYTFKVVLVFGYMECWEAE